MLEGKPTGIRCIQLGADNQCLIYDKPERPLVCANLRPLEEMCGQTAVDAFAYLAILEQITAPLKQMRYTPNGLNV